MKNFKWADMPNEMLQARGKAMMMKTTPDERLAQDFALGFLGLMVLFMIIVFMGETTTTSPADHCANVVKTHLSPYQVQQLTEGGWPYTKRAEIV